MLMDRTCSHLVPDGDVANRAGLKLEAPWTRVGPWGAGASRNSLLAVDPGDSGADVGAGNRLLLLKYNTRETSLE